MDDNSQLRLEAADAKQGAKYVVDQLQTLMNMGAPSIADMAYTIRLREKDDYKIVEKVLAKKKDNEKYAVHNLRDIVGLRIVTLYRLDALDVIPKLIEIIRRESKDENSLFVSPELEEIKIFSTSPLVDAQALPERLLSLFESLGYAHAEIVARPSDYSSIHLVAWCRGRYRDGYKKIPLEIQIRTALEDAWAEIEHKLKYKPPLNRLTGRDEAVLKGCLTHLNIMKRFIDGSAQYADQIKIQAQQVTARRFLSTTHRVIEDTTAKIHSMDIPGHIRTQIEHALEHQQEAMNPSRKGRQHAEERIGSLRYAIRELNTSLENVSQNLPDANPHKKELCDYYLRLERALCLYQLSGELNDKETLAEAIRDYQAVQTNYPDNATVRYRYGRALAAVGDRIAAIEKLEEAQELLNNGKDTSLRPDHWLRLSIPRNLGVHYWELGIDEKAALTAPSSPNAWHANFIKAYATTKAAYGLKVEPDALCDEFDRKTKYKGKLANNLLYYVLDYLENGGLPELLAEAGFRDSELDDYITLLERHVDLIEQPEAFHTMLKLYLLRNNEAGARTIAQRLMKMLRALGVADAGGHSHEEAMLRSAANVLERLEGESSA